MGLHVLEIDKGLTVEPGQRVRGHLGRDSLSEMIELVPERPSRYIAGDQRLTALDKIVTPTPQRASMQWILPATVRSEPEKLHETRVSDRALVPVAHRSRPRRPLADRPALRFARGLRGRAESSERLTSQSDLEKPPPNSKWL